VGELISVLAMLSLRVRLLDVTSRIWGIHSVHETGRFSPESCIQSNDVRPCGISVYVAKAAVLY
jgi:hypothetical protein